jgi:ribosomal protein S12 methylthiotransferase accessory factor
MTEVAASSPARLMLGPGAPADWPWHQWTDRLAQCVVAVSGSFDADWERRALDAGRDLHVPVMSVRVTPTEVLIGPLWTRGSGAGCAGCAHIRDQADSPTGTGPTTPGLASLTADYLGALAVAPLTSGELAAIHANGAIRRHRVRHTNACEVCGDPRPVAPARPLVMAEPRTLVRRPSKHAVPTRGVAPFGLDRDRMHAALVDRRFGPVTKINRKSRAPFAMTEVVLSPNSYAGFGRAMTYRDAEAVAILEAFERQAGAPDRQVLTTTSRRDLGSAAIDPTTLGDYTDRQRAAPGFRLRRYDEDAPMDWVWGHRLRDGQPVLVPAEIGFWRYRYPADQDASQPTASFFEDSSSGSALGGSFEEASLHALLELVERDAFLLAWHRACPLPAIDPTSIADRECTLLLHAIRQRGYDVHLLAASADIPLPVVWALATREDGLFPATFCAAGSSPEPAAAVRSALWEVGQLVAAGQSLNEDTARELLADPWSVRQLDQHVQINALPEKAGRATAVLGGPRVRLADAFPGWPGCFVAGARGDVTGGLEHLAALYDAAGLDEIILVEQSTSDYHDMGLAAVKAVVPGIVPMCFGQAHQRLAGLPRLERALHDARGVAVSPDEIPFDPHPFP